MVNSLIGQAAVQHHCHTARAATLTDSRRQAATEPRDGQAAQCVVTTCHARVSIALWALSKTGCVHASASPQSHANFLIVLARATARRRLCQYLVGQLLHLARGFA